MDISSHVQVLFLLGEPEVMYTTAALEFPPYTSTLLFL